MLLRQFVGAELNISQAFFVICLVVRAGSAAGGCGRRNGADAGVICRGNVGRVREGAAPKVSGFIGTLRRRDVFIAVLVGRQPVYLDARQIRTSGYGAAENGEQAY